MPEYMTVAVEVWPVAADDAGIWLVSGGDSWGFGPVEAASDVHYEVQWLLFRHDIDPGSATFIPFPAGTPVTDVIHSTSWRPDGPAIVLTYLAVVRVTGYVLETWPDAAPVTPALPAAVGKAPPHAAADVPVPRVVDVLLHGLRHLRWLMDGDAETAAALDGNWRRHLAPLEPALAAMYDERLARLAPGDAAAPAGVAAFGVHVAFPVASLAAPGRAVAVLHLGGDGLAAGAGALAGAAFPGREGHVH